MVEATSRITEVVVFGGHGARVTRAAELAWGDEGPPDEVRLSGLPLALADDGLRARVVPSEGDAPPAAPPASPGCAPGGAPPVSASQLTVSLATTATSGEDPELERAIGAADDREREARALVTALERAHTRWEGLALPPRGRLDDEWPGPTPIESRLALLALRTTRREALARELEEARLTLEDACAKKLQLEADRKRRATLDPSQLSKTISVRLAGPRAAGRAQLEVDYRVPGARWAPSYALRLVRGTEGLAAELELRAAVAQATGEDWEDVALTVITSGPDEALDVPELESLRIGRSQRPPKRGFRAPPVGSEALFADYDAARAGLLPRSAPQTHAPEPSDLLSRHAPSKTDAPASSAGYAGGGAAREAGPPEELLRSEAPMPQRMPMREQSKARFGLRRGEPVPAPEALAGLADGGAADAPPREQPRFDLDASMLDHGNLALEPPTAARRGRLVAVEAVFASVHVEVALIRQIVLRAKEHAEALGALPEGAVEPRALRGVHVVYRSKVPVRVPSSGTYQTLTLDRERAQAIERAVTVPREAPHVYRTVELQNPLALPLLAGPVDVTFDGAYVLTSTLRSTPHRGRATFGLGVHPSVRVARNASFEEASAGLMGGSTTFKHEVELEVQNLGSDAVRVDVRERIPVPPKRDADVTVEGVRAEPPWQPWNPADQQSGTEALEGGYLWQLELPPRGSRKLSFQYAIKTSAKLELQGGNRREP